MGCFPCFGSARIPDDIDNEPNEQGLYYDVSNDTGGPHLDTRGNNVDNQLRQLTISTYKNSFIDLAKQKPKHYDYIVGVLHSWFPNPPGYRFSDAWAKSRITRILNNKRSRIRRAAREAVAANNERRMLPGGVHQAEWKFALKEIQDGVQFPQQKAAHQAQLRKYGATHWGSGGKDAWKARFVSVTFSIKFYSYV